MAAMSAKILSILGIIVSIYALRVEVMSESVEDYEAMCDISEHVSCSHVLTSRWGRGFGVIGHILGEDSIFNLPNSIPGIVFYAVILYLDFLDTVKATKVMLILSALSNVMSLYLASILYFILYDFCIVCVTTYAINAGLLYVSWNKNYTLLRKNN